MVCILPDPPGCGHGFMSVETMRFLLLPIPNIGHTSQRQQISPEMRFTCDGMITKWIVGAEFDSRDNLYPELQIWRKSGDETYEKINGTFIQFPTSVTGRIYEYDDFSPIPVKAGDILGIFFPTFSFSRLILLSAVANRPTQYYRVTDSSDSSSPYNVFNIEHQLVVISSYLPLVSVEFGKHHIIMLIFILQITFSAFI